MHSRYSMPSYFATPWFWISSGIHAAILFVGSFLFFQHAQYGVSKGLSSLEVNLVEAPPAQSKEIAAATPESEPLPPVKAMPATDDLVKLASDEIKPQPKAAAVSIPKPEPRSRVKETGTGEASSTGRSRVSASAAGEARSEARPNIRSNQSPAYPQLARDHGWEGLTVLRVEVTPDGRAGAVTVESSSGHAILDDAAVRAVRRWFFTPARFAGSAVRDVLTLPIRFRLDEAS